MKTPGSGKSSSSKSKAGKGKSKSTGKFPSTKQISRTYKADARREEASSRREMTDAAHRRAEAAHYEQEAAKAEREGYKKEAEYDLAKARRETASARHDTAKARRNQAKSTRNQVKAARAGLAQPPTSGPESWNQASDPQARLDPWILGGNDWHRGCAAVALANHLLAATGMRVTDRDVLELYWLTADDPEAGAGVLATLETAAEFGLGGMRPVRLEAADLLEHAKGRDGFVSVDHVVRYQRGLGADEQHILCGDLVTRHASVNLGQEPASHLCAYREPWVGLPVSPDVRHPLIVDLRLQQAQRHQPVWDRQPSPDWGAHAGVLAGNKVITWGREVPVTGDFLAQRVAGAWQVEWPTL